MKNAHAAFGGKVALVTGGTQGLGEATARLFAERGAAGLVINGRSRERGEAVAADLRAGGCRTLFVEADLGERGSPAQIAAAADEAFGRIDCVVNAAAITDRGTILDTSLDLFDSMFAVNVRAPFFLIQAAARIMVRENIAGAMVNVVSMSGHGGQPFISAYCVSKGALQTLTRNAAYSLMRNRIRINGLNIGWMDSPGEHRIQQSFHDAPSDWLLQAEARQPFGRLLKPSEVAKTIAFLCSDESGMMTGSLVDFDQSVLGCYESPPQPPQAMSL